jgi:hypothetical protein
VLTFGVFTLAAVTLVAAVKDTLSANSSTPSPAIIFISAAGVAMSAAAIVIIISRLLRLLP